MPQQQPKTGAASVSKDLVVFSIRREANCAECGEELWKGNLLSIEKGTLFVSGAPTSTIWSTCPGGNTALTRRARKHSVLSAVVVRFSRTRGRYERQGLLVEEAALEKGWRNA